MSPSDADLRIFLLGRFEVERGGKPVPPEAWRRRRPVDLLKLLCLSPGHALHREEATDRLWPDKDLASGAYLCTLRARSGSRVDSYLQKFAVIR